MYNTTEAAMPDPRQMLVLVVDDVPMIRAVVRTVLVQIGVHDVHEAPDGAAALTMLNERSYSLVISDWNMSPMTGFELLRHLREDRRLHETPFIMMTTKDHAHAFTATRRAGVNACLVKPFMPTVLRKAIEDVWPADRASSGEDAASTAVLL